MLGFTIQICHCVCSAFMSKRLRTTLPDVPGILCSVKACSFQTCFTGQTPREWFQHWQCMWQNQSSSAPLLLPSLESDKILSIPLEFVSVPINLWSNWTITKNFETSNISTPRQEDCCSSVELTMVFIILASSYATENKKILVCCS